MLEFKEILFPVDFSETSAKLVPDVTTMAEKFGSRIHLIFVARIPDYFSIIYVPPESISKLEKELMEGAEQRLKEFKEEHFQAFSDLRTVVISGDASEEILNYARSEGIDMIIMGTHGRTGLDKIVFGSVAERVVKGTPVPVFLVNPHKR